MPPFVVRLLQLIVSLTLLVVIHEFGHFLFSRLFKVRVEKFYAFFNPDFSLFRIKRVNGKLRCRFFAPNVPDSYEEEKTTDADGNETVRYVPVDMDSLPQDDWRRSPETTEFGVGWIPFGGYCKISGMIDESMDMATMQQEPQPWEFRTKPAWQRLLIMIGGVLFNLLLAFFIYSMVLFKWGDSYVPAQELKYGLEFNEQAKTIGFMDGDIILDADGKSIREYDADLFRAVAKASYVTVLRDGQNIRIDIPEDLSLFDFTRTVPFVSIYSPMSIDSLVADGGAAVAGLLPGDTILKVNGRIADTWTRFQLAVEAEKEIVDPLSVSHRMEVVINRPGDGLDTVSVLADADMRLGIYHFSNEYTPKELDYSFFSSIPAGIAYGWNTLKSYVSDFRYVFTKEGVTSLGGFGTIGSIFPAKWNWHSFWLMTAFLSIILAFMNILPIPALDGGYVLFLIVELVTGRKPGDKFIEKANTVGMLLLVALMVFANLNDILRLFQ